MIIPRNSNSRIGKTRYPEPPRDAFPLQAAASRQVETSFHEPEARLTPAAHNTRCAAATRSRASFQLPSLSGKCGSCSSSRPDIDRNICICRVQVPVNKEKGKNIPSKKIRQTGHWLALVSSIVSHRPSQKSILQLVLASPTRPVVGCSNAGRSRNSPGVCPSPTRPCLHLHIESSNKTRLEGNPSAHHSQRLTVQPTQRRSSLDHCESFCFPNGILRHACFLRHVSRPRMCLINFDRPPFFRHGERLNPIEMKMEMLPCRWSSRTVP